MSSEIPRLCVSDILARADENNIKRAKERQRQTEESKLFALQELCDNIRCKFTEHPEEMHTFIYNTWLQMFPKDELRSHIKRLFDADVSITFREGCETTSVDWLDVKLR